MKKLLILSILFMGCDYAPTEHTHENDSLPTDGYVFIWGEYYNIEATTSLDLYGIGVPTPFPTQVCELTNLTILVLNNNQLIGEIPPEIGNLINLQVLWLNDNQLTGEIPSEIGNLTNLANLNLRNNQLTGEIPEEVCDLICDNNLWTMPPWFGGFDDNNLTNHCVYCGE